MLDDSEHKTVSVQDYRLTWLIQNRQQIYIEQLRIQEATCIQTRINDSKQRKDSKSYAKQLQRLTSDLTISEHYP